MTPQDWSQIIAEALLLVSVYAFALGFFAWSLAQAFAGVLRFIRMRGASKPFDQRVRAAHARHVRAVELLQRRIDRSGR